MAAHTVYLKTAIDVIPDLGKGDDIDDEGGDIPAARVARSFLGSRYTHDGGAYPACAFDESLTDSYEDKLVARVFIAKSSALGMAMVDKAVDFPCSEYADDCARRLAVHR